jgi:hypothetical protein
VYASMYVSMQGWQNGGSGIYRSFYTATRFSHLRRSLQSFHLRAFKFPCAELSAPPSPQLLLSQSINRRRPSIFSTSLYNPNHSDRAGNRTIYGQGRAGYGRARTRPWDYDPEAMTWSIGRYGEITVITVIRPCQGRKKMW